MIFVKAEFLEFRRLNLYRAAVFFYFKQNIKIKLNIVIIFKSLLKTILFHFQFSKDASFVSCFNDTFVQANYRNKKVGIFSFFKNDQF